MFLAAPDFTQQLIPLNSTLASTIVALLPLALLLVLLAVMRVTAWLAVIIGAIVTIIMAITIWGAPAGPTFGAWAIGAATGIWSIDWIVFWGVVIYNVLVETGAFASFRRWLVAQATADVRVQAILMAWALGALLEGLVGFGYPWAVIAPILVGLGVAEIDAIRVAAIGNNAPVSYGALGAPIIALAAVTNVPLINLSASVGRIVAILALLPPWILIYLVTGRRGLRGVWPLPVVGSLSYILGQFPTSQWLGPYLPDIIGAVVSFGALLLLLRYWRPAETLGFGGVPVTAEPGVPPGPAGPPRAVPAGTGSPGTGSPGTTGRAATGVAPAETPRPGWREAVPGLTAFGVLIVVVVAATGPWSHLGDYTFVKPEVDAISSLSHQPVAVVWKFAPAIAGTWILVSLLVILAALYPCRAQGRSGAIHDGAEAQLHSDVGRAACRADRVRAGPGVQLLRNGQHAGLRLLPCWHLVHSAGPDPGLDRCRAIGQQHLHQRAIRRIPVRRWRPAAHAFAAAAVAQLGRRRGRQAGGAADHQRGRLDQQLRAPGGRGDQAQLRLDAGPARLPDPDRHLLLLRAAGRDAAVSPRPGAGARQVHRAVAAAW